MQPFVHDDGPGTFGQRAWLLMLLGLALGPRAFDDVVAVTIAGSLHGWSNTWYFIGGTGAQVLGLVAAGLALDRFGIRNALGVSLVVWAVVAALSAAVPPGSQALHIAAHLTSIVVGLVFGLGLTVATKPAFPLARRGLALGVLNLLSVIWLMLVPIVAAGLRWPPTSLSQPSWVAGCLIASGFGAMLAILWWLTFRRRDGRAAQALVLDDRRDGGASLAEAAALFRRPGVWALAVTTTCHMLVFAVIYRILSAYVIRERLQPADAFVRSLVLPVLVWIVVQIACAVWSDVRARHTGRAAPSRVPFVVAGAVLSSAIGLLPLVGRDYFGAVYLAVALGMAAFASCATFGFDVIPKALAGRFFGLAWGLGLAVNSVFFIAAAIVNGRYHSMAVFFYLAGIAALAAAVLALTHLRKLEPIEDGPDFVGAIGKVFA